MRRFSTSILVAWTLNLVACGGGSTVEPRQAGFVINEVVSKNEGVYVDEQGELDDWIELTNASETTLSLRGFTLTDSAGVHVPLPDIEIPPKGTIVLWADDTPEQGAEHLPFKVSGSGETLTLFNPLNEIVDQVDVPALTDNHAYARFPSGTGDLGVCRYTSPGKDNGTLCQTSASPGVDDDIEFQVFAPSAWPTTVVPSGLALNEIAVLPADFIEVKNFGSHSIDLNNFSLTIAPLPASAALPTWNESTIITLPNRSLAPGEIASVGITAAQTEALRLQEYNEGVVVLYDSVSQAVIDHAAFMHWPTDAALARTTQAPYSFRFCHNLTQDLDNACEPVASRPLEHRARGLYTPADFATLANGSGLANVESVKFVVDLQSNDAVHYLSAQRWPLHYAFVREVIDGEPSLNRCDAVEEQQFNSGWSLFSQQNYFNNQTRRYHLDTLSKHANANVHTVEFTFGDVITAAQMRDVFYLSTAATANPFDWFLRPQNAEQVSRARAIEGELPIVGPNAPFQNITLQTLAPGIAYGTLQFIPTAELDTAPLGPRTIVITNDVPNDIGFIGGLITEAFQTPLAHVNILSQGRGTPNLALPDARTHSQVAPLLNKLVRLEVSAGGYALREASIGEAEAFWASANPNQEILTPRLDATTTELIDLADVGLNALPTIGAKAAQMAELFQLPSIASACAEGAHFDVPVGAFAIPVHYYLEHFSASGAQAYLASERVEDLFLSDLNYRRLVLATVKQMILEHPLDSRLLTAVQSWVQERFGNERARFRSSSNTEDLSTFNGAGLYDSVSAEIGDKKRRIDDAIRTVWASLWNMRAFDERSYANVDQTKVAMGVLVHRAFRNERANGVAIARNILSPTRTDQHYINSQAGEASVANPAPGVVTEQLVYQWPPRTPQMTYHSHSSISQANVLTPAEVRALACAMDAIQTHFRPLLDPLEEDRWFTMESEFKFLGPERQLLIKQARPYPMADLPIPNDCREF